MASANQRILEATIGHQVDLQGYGNGLVARIIGLLNKVDADLMRQLEAALESAGVSPTTDRLETLLATTRELNLQAYRELERKLTAELRELADYEAGHQMALFEAVVPAQITAHVGLAAVNVEQVYVAAMSQPFRGRLLREWAEGLEVNRIGRIRDAVRIGYAEGQTIAQIARRIRGTRAARYADGIMEIDRRDAEAVVRTAVSHMAGIVKDRHMAANADIVKAVVWRSTLDSRTSEPCRIRDGLQYTNEDHKPVGHSVPWLSGPGRLHWQCRSTSTAVLKSWQELGIDVDELSPGARASMDGQVPADVSYGAWLKNQSAARQDDIVGPTRGKLLRSGGPQMDRFYNDKGRFLSLDELRKRDASAFAAAGL